MSLKLNEEIYQFLLDFRKKTPDFTFATRVKNLKNRLSEGLWFQGNGSSYIFIGFYKIGDSKNKTKTIGFEIDLDDNSVITNHLEIICPNDLSDAENEFHIRIKEYFDTIPSLKIKDSGSNRKFQYFFETNNWVKNLQYFLDEIKPKIDSEIRNYHIEKEMFISNEEFENNISKIDLVKITPKIEELNLPIKPYLDLNHPLNTIFYGPPGTGKTYNTLIRAAEIIKDIKINAYEDAKRIFHENLGDQIEFITFHQNYSYEDFIQGLRPDTESDGDLKFYKKDGIFKKIADRALRNLNESKENSLAQKEFELVFKEFISPMVEGEVEEIEVKMKKVSFFINDITNKSIHFRKNDGESKHTLSIGTLKSMYESQGENIVLGGLMPYYNPILNLLLENGKGKGGKVERKNYVIIIDEINRANISRVFGELITLIEPEKRTGGEIPLKSTLPSGDTFQVPNNLYIVGTMNTADKSIALLDIALRRRFVFEAMYPKDFIDEKYIPDYEIFNLINKQIIAKKGYDFQIGHSYFMEKRSLVEKMNKKVIPLLLEYFMNDEKEVSEILKNAGLNINQGVWPIQIL